jgi:phosphoenolpyruvate synthase/pyruvate phosphate dikinase
MVSGTVTPDTYVIDRATRAVVTYEQGDAQAGGALDASAVADLVDLCLRVESDFGRAVDIEAAWTASGWFLLQARPITTA